jgi:protocatechuate 3,4-dioxygenase beta subunit
MAGRLGYSVAMRRKLALVGVVAALVVLAVAWKLHDRGGGSTTTASGGSAQPAAHTRHGASATTATPASLSGRVTRKSDGAGVAGAVVSVVHAEFGAMFARNDTPTIVAVADARGAWTAPQVPPGSYMVAASAAGLVPASRDKIDVTAGERRTGVDLVLDAGGTIVRGTISDVLGGPIAGARITMKASGNRLVNDGPELITNAGDDGTYQITLADGSYSAVASHDDYTKLSKPVRVAGKPQTVDFVLTPGGTIRGQVVARDDGKPVPGAVVQASGGRGGKFRGTHASAVADASGTFALKSLPSGAISVSASGRGYASASPTVVELGIGEQVDGIRVVVDRAFSISGVVVKKGKPKEGIPGVRIAAFSISAGESGTAPEPSGPDGEFEIVGVRPASYMIAALGEHVMPEIGQSIDVVDHDVHDVTIEMAAGVTIAGRVDPPGVASVGIEPTMIGIANMFEAVKAMFVHADSDATGAFTLHNVPPGAFKLTASTGDGSKGSLPIVVGEVDQLGLVVTLDKRATLSGRVIDANGAPVGNVTVSARASSGDKAEMVMAEAMSSARGGGGDKTDPDGSFRVVGVDAGKVALSVRDDQGTLAWAKADKPDRPMTVEVVKGVDQDNLTLTVEARDGVIRGQVLGADHKPAADAWVTATAESTPLISMTTFGTKDKAGQDAASDRMKDYRSLFSAPPVLTNADGKFTIDHLRRESYELVAETARGNARGDKSGVKATSGGESVTIELRTLGSLTGHVTNGGAPVTTFEVDCSGPAGRVDRHVSAPDGAYALDRLAPGSYACHAEADEGTTIGTVDVASGPATLDLALAPWASVTGVVVGALTGRPVVGLKIMAGSMGTRGISAMLTGKGPTTDATGRFVVDHLGAGKGSLAIMPATSLFEKLASRDYEVTAGQHLDLGVIKVVAPRDGEAGTLGMTTNVDGDALVVATVVPGGPAAAAGVQVGDKIVTIDGVAIAGVGADMVKTLLSSGQVATGQAFRFGLDRGGTTVTATVTAQKW